MRHPHRQTLAESAVLALVSVLLLDFAAAFTLIILQLQSNGPSKETLIERERRSLISLVTK